MNITIFGYPKTGKTTLFNLLTGSHLSAHAYCETVREPNVRAVFIPDSRLDAISSIYPDKKKTSVVIDIIDLAGISFGEVKSSLLLNHLRKADCLAHVVRGFKNESIPHPKGKILPLEDITFMEEELILADLVLLQNRLERLEKDLKKMTDPEAEKERNLLLKLQPFLEQTRSLRQYVFTPTEEKIIRCFAFLSLKPLVHIINIDETETDHIQQFEKKSSEKLTGDACEPAVPTIAAHRIMGFCGRLETEIAELEPDEREMFLKDYHLTELVRERFLRQALSFLEMDTFYTIGKDEVRAWAVRKGSLASRAAGVIHTDMEKGFIRAEVISYENFVKFGTLQKAKEAGVIRLEGKDYVVRDGDIIYFRFSR